MTEQQARQAAKQARAQDPDFFESVYPRFDPGTQRWVVVVHVSPYNSVTARTPQQVAKACQTLSYR